MPSARKSATVKSVNSAILILMDHQGRWVLIRIVLGVGGGLESSVFCLPATGLASLQILPFRRLGGNMRI